MNKVSLHTHTWRCKHAQGEVSEFCEQAIREGMPVLGFADHCPLPNGLLSGARMEPDKLDGYLEAIEEARERFPELTILSGLEIDFFPEIGRAWYEDTFFGKAKLDYLIGGVHFTRQNGDFQYLGGQIPLNDLRMIRENLDYTLELIDSGLITYLAHPDLGSYSWRNPWNDELNAMYTDLIQAAVDKDLPLEVNAYGLRKPKLVCSDGERFAYPWDPFWELASRYPVRVVAGADAHRVCDTWGNTQDAVDFAAKHGLTVVTEEVAKQIIARKK